MSKVAISEEYLTDIADSIREKLDTSDTYKVSEMSEAIDSITTGGGYTGHYDAEGLAQIGWTEDDIKYYQDNGVKWNQELDKSYKLQPYEIQTTFNNTVRFIPKNASQTSFAYYNRLIALPYVDITTSNWNGTFRSCNNLITIPLLNSSNVTGMSSLFDSCYNLRSIPLLDTKNVTTMANMFNSCYALESVPLLDTKNVTSMSSMFRTCMTLRSIPQFNTQNVTSMANMCNSCFALVDVPLLDTSKVVNFQSTFGSCNCLSDESVNNILKMCANATAYYDTKTLAYLGLSSTFYPVSKIQSLSNYQDFIDAGWTIGY